MAITLRPYQDDTVFALREGFRDGHTRQVLSASTGSGKSVVMMYMVRAALEKGSRVIFICERRQLIEQFSAHLDSEGIDHGIIMAKHWRFRPELKVQVASVQTLEKMKTWPACDLVFIDEVHASMRESVVRMLETRPRLKVIGATATPFHPLIGKYFSNVVSAPPMAKLVEMKTLVPFRVFAAREIDTEGVKVIAGEWKKDELEVRGRRIIGDIVSDYLRLSQEVFGRKSKAICFSCGIAHGNELVQSFAAVGVNAIQLASGVDDDYKADVLREFSKPGSSIDMLISVDMLSRGFDQTDIEHVILARPLKKSFSMHVQMIGRGARAHDGKSLCVVQDHCNNWIRFADEWDEFFHNGVQNLDCGADTRAKKEPTKKDKEAAKCPRCSAIWPGRSDTCLHCGHTRQRADISAASPGEMREITGNKKADKYTSEYKREWYQGMIALLRSRGKNDNRAYFLYKEKFGVDPAWKKEPGQPNQDVINDLTRANIVWSKMSKKASNQTTGVLI